jgi:hypothetical protein
MNQQNLDILQSSNVGSSASNGSTMTTEEAPREAQHEFTTEKVNTVVEGPETKGLTTSAQHQSYESFPSDVSSTSPGTHSDRHSPYFISHHENYENEYQSGNDEDSNQSNLRQRCMSPNSAYRIPPAPPSTPASHPSSVNISLLFDTMADCVGGPPTAASSITTPLSPLFEAGGHVVNDKMVQHYSYDTGQLTPAPTNHIANRAADTSRSLASTPKSTRDGGVVDAAATPKSTQPPSVPLPEDFSNWSVGDRYELVRILGRGSYGEVAQAIDRRKTNAMNGDVSYVAIKRIQSPFEQQLDAIRLYREIHILRRMKEGGDGTTNSSAQLNTNRHHDCIIQLLDVVQPAGLNDFHELYLVFECMYTKEVYVRSSFFI